MVEVLEPQHELLKRFVDSIYVLRGGMDGLAFTAYPTINTPVGLFRNTAIHAGQECINITNAETPNHFAIACNQFSDNIHLQYLQSVDEIAINFKPLGFSTFTRSKPQNEKLFYFEDWDTLLPGLFNNVFATTDIRQQLHYIEEMLLEQYIPTDEEAVLLKALELLNDVTTDHRIEEIAAVAGMHYKQLYRSFAKNIGCSPAHYRKLVKFRSSVIAKMNKSGKARLVDICYDNDYTDQAYFTRQFKALTGEKPTRFFKKVTSFGNAKVVFKMD